MSYTKSELVRLLAPAIVRRGRRTAAEVNAVLEAETVVNLQAMYRRQVETGLLQPEPTVVDVEQTLSQTVTLRDGRQLPPVREEAQRLTEQQLADKHEQLAQQEQERARQREEALREYHFAQIFRTPIDGKVAQDTVANRKEIASWVDDIHGEVLSREWFARILTTENPGLGRRLSWASADTVDPRKQAAASKQQLEEDRSTFSKAAREIGLSDNEANFRLVRETLGAGFSTYAIGQAVDEGAVRLAAASQAEQEAYRQEYQEARQEFLIHQATPQQLKEAARSETQQRRAATTQQQADQQLQAAVKRDAVMGFPPLPEDWRGQRLDANFIKMCDVATHKLLLKRFGSAQLDLRIRGLK